MKFTQYTNLKNHIQFRIKHLHMALKRFNRKQHWETIYQTKDPEQVSWFQPHPETSLSFLQQFRVPLTASIIDIGGGDSLLVDNLLDLGYQDITVLDISAAAIEKAQKRLGERAESVNWIVEDVTKFKPAKKYDFWHDRATFHFLTSEKEIEKYLRLVQNNLQTSGVLVMGTFSEQGPDKCSGIPIQKYSESNLTERLQQFFKKIKCIKVDHQTPFDTLQNFLFCSFRKLQAV